MISVCLITFCALVALFAIAAVILGALAERKGPGK